MEYHGNVQYDENSQCGFYEMQYPLPRLGHQNDQELEKEKQLSITRKLLLKSKLIFLESGFSPPQAIADN